MPQRTLASFLSGKREVSVQAKWEKPNQNENSECRLFLSLTFTAYKIYPFQPIKHAGNTINLIMTVNNAKAKLQPEKEISEDLSYNLICSSYYTFSFAAINGIPEFLSQRSASKSINEWVNGGTQTEEISEH